MSTETTSPASAEETPATPPTGPAAGEDPMMKLQADADRFRDLAARSQAELDNFRKRAIRDKEDAIKYANASLLERLIPILDNFELGLTAARADASASSLLTGMDMVAKQLNDFLTQHGVEPVKAEGEKFDPNLHEAVGQEASDTVPEGVVLRQLRGGFKLKDRLLRASMVIVSKGRAH